MLPDASMAKWCGEGLAAAACCTVGLLLMRGQLLHVMGCLQHFGTGQFDRTVQTLMVGQDGSALWRPCGLMS